MHCTLRSLPVLRTLLAAAALAAALTAQTTNSILPRGDLQLSTTPGVHNAVAGNLDAGFQMYDVASPKQDLPDRTGGLVATSRLVYAVYADQIGGNVVVQFVRSTDGGRTFAAPVTIYTCNTAGGEDLDTGDEQLDLYCYEDQVFVTLLSNSQDLAGGGQAAFALASTDQGQTWSAPVAVSPAIGVTRRDIDELRGAASATGLHLVYEWDYTASASGNENITYVRCDFGSGFGVAQTVDLTNYADGGADVDSPSIDADGAVVHIAYNANDDVVLGTTRDQSYSVTSFDNGATFSAPFNHTQFTVPSPWASARAPKAHLDGGFAYTFMEDSRIDQDDVWMDRGIVDLQTSTVQWTVRGIECSNIPTGPAGTTGQLDVDGFQVAVENGVIAILYRDDRSVATNSNFAYLACDQHGGADFVAGTASHHQLTTSTATLYDLAVTGQVVCGVWEQCSGDEEGAIVLSHDGGRTVSAFQFTTLGDCSGSPSANVDVDDLRCSVSRNGDYTVLYVDERAGGNNASNHCFLTGGKLPELRNPLLVNGSIDVRGIDPAQSGTHLGFLMISGSGTSPGHAVGGNQYGFFVGLQNDLWFQLLFASAYTTFAPISASGDATFTVPGGIPNLTALLGFPIDCAAGTVGFGPRMFASYTDPLRF